MMYVPMVDLYRINHRKIHAKTKQQQIIYTATQGAHVGVATISPVAPVRYAFIHGPENPDDLWHYDFHHRRGVIVNEQEDLGAVNIDACSPDIALSSWRVTWWNPCACV